MVRVKRVLQTVSERIVKRSIIDSLISHLPEEIIGFKRKKEKQWRERIITKLSLDRVFPFEAKNFLDFCLQNKHESRSQLFQDLFVRYQSKNQTSGYFVEFGATDGISLSNTKSLEEKLGWTGILAEPAKCWHAQLRRNRSCIIDTRCVWERTGEILEFNEVSAEAELSTLKSFIHTDHHGQARLEGNSYPVETVSLQDLLAAHHAPRTIDYLSIDTEGSELSILKAFDFDKNHIKLITVEHNYTPKREEIFKLLTRKGFLRKFTDFSLWDDWYINQSN